MILHVFERRVHQRSNIFIVLNNQNNRAKSIVQQIIFPTASSHQWFLNRSIEPASRSEIDAALPLQRILFDRTADAFAMIRTIRQNQH